MKEEGEESKKRGEREGRRERRGEDVKVNKGEGNRRTEEEK